MATTLTIPYTIDAAGLTLTDTGRVMNIPAGNPLGDLQNRDPVAYAAIKEFQSLAVTSGNVVVTAS